MLLDGWGLVGLALHGLTPHGNSTVALSALLDGMRPGRREQGCAANGACARQGVDLRGGRDVYVVRRSENGGRRDSCKFDADTVTARHLMPEEEMLPYNSCRITAFKVKA